MEYNAAKEFSMRFDSSFLFVFRIPLSNVFPFVVPLPQKTTGAENFKLIVDFFRGRDILSPWEFVQKAEQQ